MSKSSGVIGYLVGYAVGGFLGVCVWDGGCNKVTKAKEKMLENATPITNKVFSKTVTPQGDTITSERTDTVAYRVSAEHFKP